MRDQKRIHQSRFMNRDRCSLQDFMREYKGKYINEVKYPFYRWLK